MCNLQGGPKTRQIHMAPQYGAEGAVIEDVASFRQLKVLG